MTDVWRELYDTEYPRLLRALLAIGGDPDAAEDAAQEAFVKAHRTGLEHLERPGAWLLVVGTRELLRHRRRRRIEDQRWALRPRSDAPGVDSIADRADLLAALRQLPDRQRTVVVARYYYGLSMTRSPVSSRSRAAPSARRFIRRSRSCASCTSPAASRAERSDDRRARRRDPRTRALTRDRDAG